MNTAAVKHHQKQMKNEMEHMAPRKNRFLAGEWEWMEAVTGLLDALANGCICKPKAAKPKAAPKAKGTPKKKATPKTMPQYGRPKNLR